MAYLYIPVWFYELDSIMYFASAIFGFLVSYYAYKLYEMSGKRTHFCLHLAFAVLSAGLFALSVTSSYVYMNFFVKQVQPSFQAIFDVSDLGYWIYFVASLLAYLLLAWMYATEKHKLDFVPIAIPFWYTVYPHFNVISLFLLSYITFRTGVNWKIKRSLNALLVTVAFALLGIYHFLLMMSPFNEWSYVLAHFSMLLGFICLLVMLRRVSRVRN